MGQTSRLAKIDGSRVQVGRGAAGITQTVQVASDGL